MAAFTYLTLSTVLCLFCMLTPCVSQNEKRDPPHVTQPEADKKLYQKEGDSFVIQCRATGTPTPTYQWLRNEELVAPTSKITFNSSSGILQFISFDSTLQGEYMCVASNFFYTPTGSRIKASAFSSTVTVFENSAVLLNVTTVTVQHQVDQYSYERINCNPSKVVAQGYSTEWYVVTSTSKRFTLNTTVLGRYIDTSGNLHFTYATQEDQTKDIDRYRCGLFYAETQTKLGSPNRMTVNPVLDPSTIKPQLRHSNNGTKAMLFDNRVMLECVFSGYQTTEPHLPTIKWTDNAGAPINPTPNKYLLSNSDRSLTILSLKEEDEMFYYCEATNSAGTSGKQAVFLNVTSAPLGLRMPVDQKKPQDTNVDFYCEARSAIREEPPATPVWYINGQKTGNHVDPNKFKFSDDHKKLTILGVKKPDDIVCVQCKVTNSEGSIWGNGCLNVVLPITITHQPPSVQEVSYGDIVNLTVTASTDPAETLVFTWEFRNETYVGQDAPPYVTYNPNTLLAYINTSKLSQEEFEKIGGVYIRVVSNTVENKRIRTEVIYKDRPDPIKVAGDGFHLWIIGIIILIIILLIILFIIILLCCRRQQGGVYNVDKKETDAGHEPEKELEMNRFDDFSRPDEEESDFKPPPYTQGRDFDYDDFPARSEDDDASLDDYDKDDSNFFNENGSFIGIYGNKKDKQKGGQQVVDNPAYDSTV